MASTYEDAPDSASSEEGTSDFPIADVNLGAPSNAMMGSPTLSAQASGPGDEQADGPEDEQASGARDEESKTLSIQPSEHDSGGGEGYDPSAQPRYHQEPSDESSKNDEGLEDVYIAVMGVTGAGKSTFIEKLTGKEIGIGHGLSSCTADTEEYTFVYEHQYMVHLIDTPGFDDTTRKDIDVLRDISGWLGEAYINDIKLNGIIYLHRITDVRMTGTARKNLFMFKKLCGPDCFQKVCLVTTMWENVDERTGKMREKGLIETEDFWGYMAQNGSQVRRHMNTRESGMSILRTLIKVKLNIVLDIQKELGNGVQLDDTGAGRHLNEEIQKVQEKHRQELANLEKEKLDALRRRDAESVKQIEELQRENAQKLEQMARDRESIKVDMAKLLELREQQLREQEESIARFDHHLQEQQEELKQLKEKQSMDESNPEQTRALQQEIKTMEQRIKTMEENSQSQHEKVKQKKTWMRKSVSWISKFLKVGGAIGVQVLNAQ